MIVSEFEIHKVIDLLLKPTVPPSLRPFADDQTQAPAAAPGRPGDICADDGRRGRLDCLRFLLSHGQYDVAPTMVADKMVGRAICDQVARLYDN